MEEDANQTEGVPAIVSGSRSTIEDFCYMETSEKRTIMMEHSMRSSRAMFTGFANFTIIQRRIDIADTS